MTVTDGRWTLPAWVHADSPSTRRRYTCSRCCCPNDRVTGHVDVTGGGSIDFAAMLDEGGWSSGERSIVATAASLFGHGVDVDLGEMCGTLGPVLWERIERALYVRRGRLLLSHALGIEPMPAERVRHVGTVVGALWDELPDPRALGDVDGLLGVDLLNLSFRLHAEADRLFDAAGTGG